MLLVLLLVLLALAVGCAQHARPPVVDRSAAVDRPTAAQRASRRTPDPQVQRVPNTHVVRAGDTLYSIAWRFGLDYRDLARANGIGPPYVIYVGQQIRLTIPPRAAPAPAQPAPSQPVRPPVAAPSPPASIPAPATVPAPAKPAPAKPAPAPSLPAVTTWRRPTAAPVQRGFGNGNRGIDYRLRPNDSVLAAAAGEVVYAGSGLGGFLHLVIVKHDSVHLSAYSFDRGLAVREGQMVAAGARLGDAQAGGASSTLRFEIRRNGNPVDPGALLGGS